MPKKNLDLPDNYIQIENQHPVSTKYEEVKENIERNLDSEYSETKEKRINMAFTDNNYEFIVSETSKLGASFVSFINYVISSVSIEDINSFIESHPWLKEGRSSALRRRGFHMKRINFKIFAQNYDKLQECASRHNATITAIVNIALDIYMSKITKE